MIFFEKIEIFSKKTDSVFDSVSLIPPDLIRFFTPNAASEIPPFRPFGKIAEFYRISLWKNLWKL